MRASVLLPRVRIREVWLGERSDDLPPLGRLEVAVRVGVPRCGVVVLVLLLVGGVEIFTLRALGANLDDYRRVFGAIVVEGGAR